MRALVPSGGRSLVGDWSGGLANGTVLPHRTKAMNRTEFIIAATIILFGAYMLGWFTHWLLHRFTRVAGGDMGEIDRLAQSLHDAEELRDQAMIYMETREAELVNQLSQTEAELRAAMEGLRAARHEGEEMRTYIERIHAAG